MCGIAGIVSLEPKEIEKMPGSLRKMTDAIVHRGPDGDGFWQNPGKQVALGHRRLKIIDLSENASQPMHYAGRYSITYNGEIYNYRELKDELISKKYIFKNHSDTEVVLAAYDCWQEDCVAHFDGMFAFAIWDEKAEVLFCARDRFGEKPFYFFNDDTRFLFASEMKSLWAAGVSRDIDNTRLLNYISIGLVDDITNPANTFFQNIHSLQPGHFLKLRLADFDISMVRYWDIDKESTDHGISEEDAVDKFSYLLKRSVERRLRSDVTVGTSLSGGLDSSSIVSLIHSLQSANSLLPGLQTFSAVFPGFAKDESAYIRESVHRFQLNNFQTMPEADQLVNDFDRLMYHQEEPLQSLSVYAQYKVYEMAKQHDVTVLLDGQGADETLAGYYKYYPWYWQELLSENYLDFKAARKKTELLGIGIPWGFKNVMAAFMPALAAAKLEKKAYRGQAQHKGLAADFFSDNADRQSLVNPIIRKLNDILYFHTCQLGLKELLRYADRNSMAHGREVRLPFLDHELVQFIFSLPSHFKIKDGWTKWILRKSMDNSLPPSITWCKDKIGFEPPQHQWMHHKKMAGRIMDSRDKLVREKILKPSVMQQPVHAGNAHQQGNDDFRYLCAAAIL